MSQPVSFGEGLRFSGTAAGTTVVRSRSANLIRVIIPTTKTGTVSIYDTNVATGTTATNFIMAIQNTAGTIPTSAEIGITTKNGIVAVGGGTTDLVLVVE